ncbi:GPI ethanolamine phosphate transferase 2-like [Capsicum chacoense]
MIVSCLILLSLLFLLGKQVLSEQNKQFSSVNNDLSRWHLDDIFILVVIVVVVISMGSSSLVEEEQYIWHFMTSSLYLLSFRKLMQHIVTRTEKNTRATVGSKTILYPDLLNSCDSHFWENFERMASRFLGFCSTAILVAVPRIYLSQILLLQQPVNSMPVLFLFLQVLASVWYFSGSNQHLRQFVAALYYMGMAGHFGLGKTNTLATIDVAGAFIGVLDHSTHGDVHSVKDTSGFIISQDGKLTRCSRGHLVFLVWSVGFEFHSLVAYTIVLLLMRNHLFVLIVCATTVCVALVYLLCLRLCSISVCLGIPKKLQVIQT